MRYFKNHKYTNSVNQSITTKKQIAILGLGTFLEYFDLMLYVHMAFFLNDLFFPKTDTLSESLLLSFSFCSTFVFRPFGALIFGYIGDKIGRKATIIITTLMMAVSSLTMALLPTYAQIGIAASWLITLCRIVQGMSSIGEVVGAEIYLTETTAPPAQYPIVASVAICATLGSVFALGISYVFLRYGLNWRYLFLFGSGIAIVGIFARISLPESATLLLARQRLSELLKKTKATNIFLPKNPLLEQKVNLKSFMAFLLIHAAWPLFFYFSYIYCGGMLRSSFGFSPNQVIFQNFIVCCFELTGYILLASLSYRIRPLLLLNIKFIIFFPFCAILPMVLSKVANSWHVLAIQIFIMLFSSCYTPAMPIFLKFLPVLQRFRVASLTYAISRAIVYVITSYGLVTLERYISGGMLWLFIPFNLGFIWGVAHFQSLQAAQNIE